MPDLYATLYNSISQGKELVSLLIYRPNNDPKDGIVQGIVLSEILENEKVIQFSSDSECMVNESLLEKIKKFNMGELKELYIGKIKIGSKALGSDFAGVEIIPYHTHPLIDQDIFSSKEDINEIKQRWGSSAIITASRKARDKYGMKPPFVAGYSDQKGNYAGIPLDKLSPLEIDLNLGEHLGQCRLSANFEIVK